MTMDLNEYEITEDGTLDLLRRENDELRREVESLRMFRAMAYRDPLTGLHNRRYFEERLAEELDRARRNKTRFSILVVDVNDFKSINDTYGHLVGDQALKWIAELLIRSVRKHDIVCRTGGDEFMLILPYANELGREFVTSRIRERLIHENAGRSLAVHLSIGGATWPQPGLSGGTFADDSTIEDLIELADRMMYQNKIQDKIRRSPLRIVTGTPVGVEEPAMEQIGRAV